MISLEKGGWQLAVLKKTEKAVQRGLKVKMESCYPHGPRLNKLTFDGEVGYKWEAPSTTDL